MTSVGKDYSKPQTTDYSYVESGWKILNVMAYASHVLYAQRTVTPSNDTYFGGPGDDKVMRYIHTTKASQLFHLDTSQSSGSNVLQWESIHEATSSSRKT